MHLVEQGTSMTPVTFVGCLLAFVALVTAEDEIVSDVGDKSANVVAVIDDYIDEYEIRCHTCMKSAHGDDCVTMQNTTKIESKLCVQNEFFCTMEWEKIEGRMTTFSRGCGNSECKSGCRISDGPYRLEKCLECCTGDLCNRIPGSAHKFMTSSKFVVFTTLVSMVFSLMT